MTAKSGADEMQNEELMPGVKKQVAIVGGAKSRHKAPYTDNSWEIWAFSSLRVDTPRISRWFEMHALGDLKGQLKKDTNKRLSYPSYLQFLKQLKCPVYMQKADAAIPNSVEYPLRQALASFGRCFTSTASYLIALAIMEQYETIGVWGIHLTEKTVYARQRPGVEYLLSVANDRGIHLYLPKGCPLRVPTTPKITPTDILYGYDWESPKAWWRKKRTRRKRRSRRRSR